AAHSLVRTVAERRELERQLSDARVAHLERVEVELLRVEAVRDDDLLRRRRRLLRLVLEIDRILELRARRDWIAEIVASLLVVRIPRVDDPKRALEGEVEDGGRRKRGRSGKRGLIA